MTLPPVTAARARAALALVSASRHGTESERRKWLFRFVKAHGPRPAAIDWHQPVQKIPFSIVAAACRERKHAREFLAGETAFLLCCLHAGQTGGVGYSYPETGYHRDHGTHGETPE